MPELEARIREWKRLLAVAFGGPGEILEELDFRRPGRIGRLQFLLRPAAFAGNKQLVLFTKLTVDFGQSSTHQFSILRLLKIRVRFIDERR